MADADRALRDAREIGHAATLMYALSHGSLVRYECGNYASATAVFDELVALAEEKGTLFWKAFGMMNQGCACALSGNPSDAVRMITRCPTIPTPRSFKSSAVKLGKTEASISFSRNAASYRSRPRLRSQPERSIYCPSYPRRRMIVRVTRPVQALLLD
jgi:hypothetical protein